MAKSQSFDQLVALRLLHVPHGLHGLSRALGNILKQGLVIQGVFFNCPTPLRVGIFLKQSEILGGGAVKKNTLYKEESETWT